MSEKSYSVGNLSLQEIEYKDFIIARIKSAGGAVQFQHLTGHLSQLSFEVRNSVGTSKQDLMKFLKKLNNIFHINDKGAVTLSTCGTKPTEENKLLECEDLHHNVNSKDSSPETIQQGNGIICSLFPKFGFIGIKLPFETSVYFTPENFGEEGKSLTTDFDISIGNKIFFNAVKGNKDYECKYRATKVWRPQVAKTRKDRESGLYDPVTKEDFGRIENVFPTHGFIAVTNDTQNKVFFHKNHVCKYENVVDLTKIMKVNDVVQFSAIRSTKKDSKVRWEATKVWLKKKVSERSEESSDILVPVGDKIKKAKSTQSMHSHSKSSKSRSDFQSIESVSEVSNQTKERNSSKEMLTNENGKVYPHSQGVVIKFGLDLKELADADSCLFYISKNKVIDIGWEFNDGDDVKFDAVKIKSAPGWKAVLVWVGDKPNVVLPPHLGDFSEFYDEEIENVLESDSYTSRTSDASILSDVSYSSAKSEYNSYNQVRSKSVSGSRSIKSSVSGSDIHVESGSPMRSHNNVQNNLSAMHKTYAQPPSRWNSNARTKSSSSDKRDSRASRKNSKSAVKEKELYNDFNGDSNFKYEDSRASRKNSKSAVKEKVLYNDFNGDSNFKYETYTNWGDSPYPDEDLDTSVLSSELKNVNEVICNKVNNPSSEHVNEVTSNKVNNESSEFDNINDVAFNKMNDLKSINSNKHGSENIYYEEILSSEYEDIIDDTGEICEADLNNSLMTDKINPKVEQNDLEFVPKSDSFIEVEKIKEPKIEPFIKSFYGIEGKIMKVFCRYAEVENKELQKPVAVFWNDLFRNGVPISNHFDDLKEVLKVGDKIKFDSYEILDDNGVFWQRVTMAWFGVKPNEKQMTVEEYISENNISVTVKQELTNSELQEKANTEKAKINPPKKFLTVAHSNDNNEENSNLSLKFQYTDEETLLHNELSPLVVQNECSSNLRKNSLEDKFPVDKEKITEEVSRMMKRGGLTGRTHGCLQEISADIVNYILKYAAPACSTTSVKTTHLEEGLQTKPEVMLKTTVKPVHSSANMSCQGASLADKSVQTIITGELIIQSVFPE